MNFVHVKKLFSVSLLTGLIFLAACSSNPSTTNETTTNPSTTETNGDSKAVTKAKEEYIFATGPTGGSFYPLGGVISEMWNHNVEGVNVTAQVTAAGFENLRLLQSEEAAFALLPESISYFGATGTGIAAEMGEKFENYSVIARVYPEAVQAFAHKDSDIQSLADFKGKKISIGAPGGYQQVLAKQVFDLAGLTEEDYEPSYTGYSEAGNLYQDNMIDGGFFLTGVPNSTLTQLNSSAPFRLIPIEDNVISELQKEIPFASKMEVPQDAYSSLEGSTQTFSIWALILVRNDLPEESVYELTKALFENAESLGEVNAQAKWLDPKNVEGLSLPLHPGAEQYYVELGVK